MNPSFALRNFCYKSVNETFCDEEPNSFKAFLYVLRMHSEDLGGNNPTRSPGWWYRSSHLYCNSEGCSIFKGQSSRTNTSPGPYLSFARN